MSEFEPHGLRLIPLIHRATHQIAIFLEEAEPPLDVSQGEVHLLAHLVESGASSVGDLHRAFAHKRSTLTSYLDRLEAKGLVRRELHPDDRRSFVVRLTKSGAALARRAHGVLQKLEEAALAPLAARDVRGFEAVLDAVLACTSRTGKRE